MAGLIRRNQGTVARPQLTDPFDQLGRAFGGGLATLGFNPAFELKETKRAFVLKADLPGVNEEDVDVSITGNRLTISGKREQERREEGDHEFVFERSFGTFSRSFAVPAECDADQISAELKNGVLTVELPKKADSQSRKISLKGLKDKVAGKLKA